MAKRFDRLLKRALREGRPATSMLHGIAGLAHEAFAVVDDDGRPLFDHGGADGSSRTRIEMKGTTLGWVTGERQHPELGAFLAEAARLELEKAELADELLDRYRELNLLYKLSEKLGGSLELRDVAGVTLEEARRLIASPCGAIFLVSEDGDHLYLASTVGEGLAPAEEAAVGKGIVGAVAASGKAEVVTDVARDARAHYFERSLASLACAPLKMAEHVIGAIVLASKEAVEYSAGDLKLLDAVAAYASPAIEHAISHARALARAREREERLRREVDILRSELDEARQAKQVSEITESEYFHRLRNQAESLRKIFAEDE